MTAETIKDELNNVPGGLTVGDLIELLEQHRPVKRPDRWAIGADQWEIHCKVCDGNMWHVWKDGNKPIECYQWATVRPAVLKQFNLVEVNGVYDVIRS